MARTSVLVTTAGTIVAQGIIKCLKLANSRRTFPTYRIVSVDMSPDAAGLYRSDAGYLVPPISSKAYIASISKICSKERIRALFVGADEELHKMAKSVDKLEKLGTTVISNPVETIATCADKWETFRFLKSNNLPCADSALPENLKEFVAKHNYPIIVKPREGHGSLNVTVARDSYELERATSDILRAGWRPMLQEYVAESEAEFTIGVTIDRDGKYVMSSIAMKRTLKAGQTNKAFVDDYKAIRGICEKVSLKLGGRGPLNIQGRLSGDELKIFEINPRFSASCPIRAIAGVNEPDIVFRNFVAGEDIKTKSYRRIVCMRYWNETYLPYSSFEVMKKNKKLEGPKSEVPDYF